MVWFRHNVFPSIIVVSPSWEIRGSIVNVSVSVSPQICSCAHWTLIDEVAWGGVSSCICIKIVKLVEGNIFDF